MAMTIEQERKAFEDWLTDCDTNPQAPPRDSRGNYLESDVRDMWRVWQARAHLTQPAQAVDAGAIREVVDRLTDGNPYGMSRGVCQSLADRLTRALSAEKAGWRNGERSEVWVVQDEAGQPVHCAAWPEACHEHINDAINEHGIEEAKAWKVLHYTNGVRQ